MQRLAPELSQAFIERISDQFRDEEKSGTANLRKCDPDQYRGITEVRDHPERAVQRRWCQSRAKVSVIMPVHNTAAYLRRALDSILNQTMDQLDIIVVDDGSVDGSIEILEEYFEREPRIRLFSTPNRGQSAARNLGLQEAVADYVAFIDGDDFYEDHAIEWLYEGLTANGAGLSIGSAHVLFESGTRTAVQRRQDTNYYHLPYGGRFRMTSKRLEEVDVCIWNKLFRREVIENSNLRFPVDLKYEDAYFVNAYSWLVDTVVFLDPDKYVYNYLRRRGSTMDNTFATGAHALDHLEVAFRLLDVLKAHDLEDEYGRYYMKLLLDYVRLTQVLVRGDDVEAMWKTTARWISYHYQTLARLGPSALAQIVGMVPAPYRRYFVGSGA